MPLPAKPTFVWRIAKYTAGVHREYEKRLYRAATTVQNQVKRNLSISAIKITKVEIVTKKGKKRTVKVRTLEHSKPGEYPRAITGLLRNSISSKVESATLRAWVYSNLNYALWLEFDTVKIKGRTFLRRTLVEMLPQIRAILNRPLPAGIAGGGKLLIGK